MCHVVVHLYSSFDFSHRDADTDSVNTMVVHEDEGEGGEEEQAGGYGDQTMLVQRVSHIYRVCVCACACPQKRLFVAFITKLTAKEFQLFRKQLNLNPVLFCE